MMDSQQPDEGDFPPNPFVSSTDDTSSDFQSATPSFAQFAQPPPSTAVSQQQSLPMPIPPAPQLVTHIDPSESSFAPIVTNPYVGSGAMDGGAPGSSARDGSRMTMNSGGASGIAPTDGQPLRGGGLGPIAQVQRCCSVDTYKSYFDVDTIDVQNRIVAALLTCNIPDGFRYNVIGVNNPEGKGPDLYVMTFPCACLCDRYFSSLNDHSCKSPFFLLKVWSLLDNDHSDIFLGGHFKYAFIFPYNRRKF
mmetsp:Transcript_29199/g.86441  ORF Transcript_29199/g.86441 Transcript_29199/m.86441 type:complete len:249 (-) Transcript_29199:732-1478(-)